MDGKAQNGEHRVVIVGAGFGGLNAAETLARARAYAGAAIDALDRFPDSKLRRALIEAAAFATERGF